MIPQGSHEDEQHQIGVGGGRRVSLFGFYAGPGFYGGIGMGFYPGYYGKLKIQSDYVG